MHPKFSRILNVGKKCIFAIVVILLILYLHNDWQKIKATVFNIELKAICLVILIYVLYALVSVKILKRGCFGREQTSEAGLFEYMFVNSASSVAGFIFPSGATPTKVLFLKYFFRFDAASGISIVIGITLSYLFASGILALVIGLWVTNFLVDFQGLNGMVASILWALVALLTALISVFIFLPLVGRYLNIWRATIDKIEMKSWCDFFYMIVLSILLIFLSSTVFFLYNYDTNAGHTFIIYSLLISISGLVSVISITPGNIGIREGIFFVLAPQFGVDPSHLVAISIVDRFVQMIFFSSLSGGLYFLFKRNGRLEK